MLLTKDSVTKIIINRYIRSAATIGLEDPSQILLGGKKKTFLDLKTDI